MDIDIDIDKEEQQHKRPTSARGNASAVGQVRCFYSDQLVLFVISWIQNLPAERLAIAKSGSTFPEHFAIASFPWLRKRAPLLLVLQFQSRFVARERDFLIFY